MPIPPAEITFSTFPADHQYSAHPGPIRLLAELSSSKRFDASRDTDRKSSRQTPSDETSECTSDGDLNIDKRGIESQPMAVRDANNTNVAYLYKGQKTKF